MKPLYTIGYEGAQIDRFIERLLSARIGVLADVRAVPISRKKGFSKNSLRSALSDAGIEYQHFRDLGDPKAGRMAARAGKFDQFRRIYGTHLSTPPARIALDELEKVVGNAVCCLMCFERDPLNCHRTLIAQQLADRGMIISNLFIDFDSTHVDAKQHLSRVNSYQSGAARQ